MDTDFVALARELAQVKHPVNLPSSGDWKSLEAELRYAFPSDFKRLLEVIGEGTFGCGLNLRSPGSSSEYTQLSRESIIAHHELIADLEERIVLPIYPTDDGMVVIGGIDRQEFFFKPSNADKIMDQLIWLNLDTEEVRFLPHTISQFIVELYRGNIGEAWETELRDYIWRRGKEPFFRPNQSRGKKG